MESTGGVPRPSPGLAHLGSQTAQPPQVGGLVRLCSLRENLGATVDGIDFRTDTLYVVQLG